MYTVLQVHLLDHSIIKKKLTIFHRDDLSDFQVSNRREVQDIAGVRKAKI